MWYGQKGIFCLLQIKRMAWTSVYIPRSIFDRNHLGLFDSITPFNFMHLLITLSSMTNEEETMWSPRFCLSFFYPLLFIKLFVRILSNEVKKLDNYFCLVLLCFWLSLIFGLFGFNYSVSYYNSLKKKAGLRCRQLDLCLELEILREIGQVENAMQLTYLITYKTWFFFLNVSVAFAYRIKSLITATSVERNINKLKLLKSYRRRRICLNKDQINWFYYRLKKKCQIKSIIIVWEMIFFISKYLMDKF